VVTHGCRYNQFESAEISQHLRDEGFEVVPESQEADLYVINTCTVTGRSDYKSRQSIRKASSRNKDAAIVVTGCYSQMNPEEIVEKTEADLVVGNVEKYDLGRYLEKAGLWKDGRLQRRKMPAGIFVDGLSQNARFKSLPVDNIPGRTTAYLKVQTGCSHACSFCIVTLARGDSISDDPLNVIHRFKEIVESGSREIILTGIHLGSYGKDLTPKTSLFRLLEQLAGLDGDFRIRLSSLGPMDIQDALIALMRDSKKICPSLHLPLQSGADHILASMKRNYTSAQYRRVFEKILSQVEDVGIGADVMVGFPGETKEMFQETARMIQGLPFAYLHVFHYSERPGTEAVRLPHKVPPQVGKERAEELKAIGLQKSLKFRKRFIGSNRDVLVEKKRDRKTGLLKGNTDNFIPVFLERGEETKDRLKKVRLTRMEGVQVFGRISQ
jgi:threonylcarbamoyladenosine tRNA methylthiotransferase MtaB